MTLDSWSENACLNEFSGKTHIDCNVPLICTILEGREGGWDFSLTGKDLMFQMTTFFSGRYFALPMLVLNLGESASLGTGTAISTPLATDCFLNWPFAFTESERKRETHGQHAFFSSEQAYLSQETESPSNYVRNKLIKLQSLFLTLLIVHWHKKSSLFSPKLLKIPF